MTALNDPKRWEPIKGEEAFLVNAAGVMRVVLVDVPGLYNMWYADQDTVARGTFRVRSTQDPPSAPFIVVHMLVREDGVQAILEKNNW